MPISAILTDIEGTTSSISFVKDVLFPYARRALPGYVSEHADAPAVRHWLDAIAVETGATDDAAHVATLQRWIDEDRKHTALKALQGMVWADGYARGDFKAPVYPDVLDALRHWYSAGLPLYVYSSGSVAAQKLLFQHCDAGDISALFSDFFDTEVGGKREAASYRRIAGTIGIPADEILFLSDVIEELDAARDAGMRTVLVDRLSDYPEPRLDTRGHARVDAFTAITFDR